MKILILLPRVPYPLEKGDKLRAYHLIKGLKDANEIILCTLNDTSLSQTTISKVKEICHDLEIIDLPKSSIPINMAGAVFKGLPFQVGYFYNSKAHSKIRSLIQKHKPDLIFCQLLRTAQYLSDINSIPRVIDFQDVFSTGMKRRISTEAFFKKLFVRKEADLLEKYESYLKDEFEGWTIITEQDRDSFPHPDRSDIKIIANGVDSEYFSAFSREKIFDIVFTGNMAYPPNVLACEYLVEEILPALNKRKAGLKILLAGATPNARVKSLAGEQVVVSGWMDDIRDAYAESKIFVAPMMIGTGLQNKLLEAMSMSLPSVTSSLANNALGAIDGKEILVADHPERFADHILDLLESEDRSKSISEAGRKLVVDRFGWKAKCSELQSYLEQVKDEYKK